jgi:tetratricopeptide (TPR) repeat protein
MSDSSGNGRIAAVLIILVVLAGGGTLTYFGLQSAPPPASPPPAIATPTTPPPVQPASNAATPPSAGRPADPRVIDEIISAVDKFESQNEQEKARVALAAAIQTYPTEQSLRVRLARVLGGLSQVAESHEQYEKAIAIGPRSATIEFEAGTMANAAGLTQRALEHFSAAQAIDASNADYPLYLAQIQRKLGQVDDAKASLIRAGKLRPDAPVVWGTLADIALEENKPTIAKQHIAKARELEPRSTPWRMIEARTLNRLGQPEQALGVLAGITDAERSLRPVARITGESLGLLNRVSDAAEMFAEASDAHADDAELALDAATWLQRAGDLARAKTYAARSSMLGNKQAEALKQSLDAAK